MTVGFDTAVGTEVFIANNLIPLPTCTRPATFAAISRSTKTTRSSSYASRQVSRDTHQEVGTALVQNDMNITTGTAISSTGTTASSTSVTTVCAVRSV